MSSFEEEPRDHESGRIEIVPNVFVHPDIVPGELCGYVFAGPDRGLETSKLDEIGGSATIYFEPRDDEDRLRIIEGQRKGMTQFKEYIPAAIQVIEFNSAEITRLRKKFNS
jgi:hypothetical protein